MSILTADNYYNMGVEYDDIEENQIPELREEMDCLFEKIQTLKARLETLRVDMEACKNNMTKIEKDKYAEMRSEGV